MTMLFESFQNLGVRNEGPSAPPEMFAQLEAATGALEAVEEGQPLGFVASVEKLFLPCKTGKKRRLVLEERVKGTGGF